MKKLISAMLAMAMTFSLVACGGNTEETTKTIAVIAKGESHAFWQAVKAGAEKAGKEKGYKNIVLTLPVGYQTSISLVNKAKKIF